MSYKKRIKMFFYIPIQKDLPYISHKKSKGNTVSLDLLYEGEKK